MKCVASRKTIVILWLFAVTVQAVIQNIKIGAIFHEGDEELEAAFDDAIRDLSDEVTNNFNFVPVKKTNVPKDSFRTVHAVCDILQSGVAAIFGPKDYPTREIAANIAKRVDVPHISYSFQRSDDVTDDPESINVYPSSIIFEKVIAEIIKRMSWHSYTLIYQTTDALSRVQEALQTRDQSAPVTIKELQSMREISMLPTEEDQDNVYESIIKEIRLAAQYSILLDIENDNLQKLFDVMGKMELMSDYFMCFIINLDTTSHRMKEFISKDSVSNITWLKFMPDDYDGKPVEAALLYDAVFALNNAMNHVYKEMNPEDSLIPKPLSCKGEEKYNAGPNITAAFYEKTRVGRKTGLMTFDDKKQRQFELKVVNSQAGSESIVGEWTNNELLISRNEREINSSLTEAAQSKIFRVVTRIGAPYVMEAEGDMKGRPIGEKQYVGYCVDLISKIEEFLKIKCEFQLVPDNNYGSLNPQTHQWNGLVKHLLELKADLAICDLTITSERQSAVDFTAPFMNLGISILFSKPTKEDPKLFAFMDPLSTEVWMYMATAYLFVSLMLFFQARMAPGEWINPHPCNPEPEELENSFTLMNSIWLTMGSLMQQGCDILPRTPSIRMVAGMWWFFVLIMVSSYTANLAAFLTAVKMDDSINDVEDLAKQTKISYGAVKDASTYSFFKNSNESLYQKIFNTMADTKPSVFTKNNDEGVDRVIKGKRKYAFFMESTGIEYQIERHCELQMVGALLDNKGYGIALPPNSPYRTMISTAILHLSEKGDLSQLKQKWWKDMGGGKCKEDSAEPANSNELGMMHVGGVFLVLILGCVISSMIAIGEFMWNVRQIAVEDNITFSEALIAELKFVVNVFALTKPVKKDKSSKSASARQSSHKSDSLNASRASSLRRGDLESALSSEHIRTDREDSNA